MEELLNSLRAHLSRLTAELSEHRQLLAELRTLRDQDVATLQEKSRDIDRLKEEVERLSGEVEVLRGVVEEGLKERREVRERSIANTSEDGGSAPASQHSQASDVTTEVVGSDSSNEISHQSKTPTSLHPASHSIVVEPDPEADASWHAKPYIDAEELDRISLEVEERRSERSMSRSVCSTSRFRESSKSQVHSRPSSPLVSTASVSSPSARTRKENPDTNLAVEGRKPPSPSPLPHHLSREESSLSKQPAAQGLGDSNATPFPHVRGSRMERLFFAAPQHDTRTCRLCHKRRPLVAATNSVEARHVWGLDRSVSRGGPESVGGFMGHGRGSEPEQAPNPPSVTDLPDQEKLPPQTVLTRVLRELEDDFTHYKAFVLYPPGDY